MNLTLDDAIKGTINAARADIDRGVFDIQKLPDDLMATPELIGDMFRLCGWAWYLEPTDFKYMEKTLEEDYQEWCGLAVASWMLRCGDYLFDDRCVNLSLKHEIAYYVLPGTARILGDSKWEQAGVPGPIRPSPKDIRPGDIPLTTNDDGVISHITLATSEVDDKGQFTTIEGNAYGFMRPHKPFYGEGVVERVDKVCHDYRGVRKTVTPRSIDDVGAVVRPDERWWVGLKDLEA